MSVSHAPLSPPAFLERSTDVRAQRHAVVDGEREWTYAEHHERVRRAAGAVRELGVRAGERVATLLPKTATGKVQKFVLREQLARA
jgi:fatty-acyl-CoA synthase